MLHEIADFGRRQVAAELLTEIGGVRRPAEQAVDTAVTRLESVKAGG